MTWKEMDGVTNDRLLVAPAAAGDTAVTLDTVEGIVVGGEITIIPCSDDPCFTHPFISEVTAVDPAT